VDALIDNDLATAYAYFKMALEIQQDLAYVWSNLGVIYRRNAQIDDARIAYQAALEIDPRNSVSLNNLYLILEEEGNLEAAEALAARVEKIRRNNPHYLHYLAKIATGEERYSDAVELLNRAIRLEKSEYRFHQTLAQSQFLTGQTEKAQASLARAKKLAPPELDPNAINLSDEYGLPDS
jgi:Flp pilus assembly protein TadD